MKLQMSAAEAKALLKAQVNGELPDERGRFGPFGGRYVPETLVPAFEKLEQGVREYLHDEDFQAEFRRELREWVGRPTALSYAPRLSERWGTEVWLVAGLGRRLPGPYVEAMVARIDELCSDLDPWDLDVEMLPTSMVSSISLLLYGRAHCARRAGYPGRRRSRPHRGRNAHCR